MKKKLSLSGVHVIVVVIFYKRKCDVRFDLLKWGMYEKYTSWEFHGELYDDSSDEENDNGNVFGNHDSGFAMLQDACGVAAMNVGLDEDTSNENNLMPEEPNADAQKFYRLLKEYQQPLTVDGKSKDTTKARIDLMKMKVRSELHPILDGDKVRVPVACYSLSSSAKAAICDMFTKIKSPDGYLSNISRCVKDNGKKISCLKSHDHRVFIEQLLPLVTRGFLPKYIQTLKSYVRNRAHPEGSIAEGYLADECLTFCSRLGYGSFAKVPSLWMLKEDGYFGH
uniref:DUF4218 domain-containing protein n=1 Tax=Chenopodium quinoa TaxID=63459 RepID=A0A803MV00_CHEQI